MTTSEQTNEIATALAKAQAQMTGAAKDSANPFFKSKYADLASVREACAGPLSANGIAVVQSPEVQGVQVTVETRFLHTSGQWIAGSLSCAAKDDGAQSIGSAITYLRRYALQSFAGVAPEDDDGEAAEGRKAGRAPVAMPATMPAPPKGYQDWLDDMAAAVDEGTAQLEKAWKGSKQEYRAFLTTYSPKHWDAMKSRAAKLPDGLLR